MLEIPIREPPEAKKRLRRNAKALKHHGTAKPCANDSTLAAGYRAKAINEWQGLRKYTNGGSLASCKKKKNCSVGMHSGDRFLRLRSNKGGLPHRAFARTFDVRKVRKKAHHFLHASTKNARD